MRHAPRAAHPLIDLSPFRVPSFAITVTGGVAFRTAISAAPFLLPLMFQLGFGFDPLDSGLLLLGVFAGNLGMKPATNLVLGRFGFRPTLIWNGLLAVATVFACGFITATTPVIVILALLFASGLTRSMEFTTINALSFGDLDHARMSGANTLFSMLQQMGNALGVAGGAILLRMAALTHGGEAGATVGDFHMAFWASRSSASPASGTSAVCRSKPAPRCRRRKRLHPPLLHPPLKGEGRIANGDPGWGDSASANTAQRACAEALSPPPATALRRSRPPPSRGR